VAPAPERPPGIWEKNNHPGEENKGGRAGPGNVILFTMLGDFVVILY
jgi:hypothetical protein